MALKLDLLRAFAAVARHGTLAAAAEELGRTPSALSMALAQLEAHVGAPLFEGDRKNRLSGLGLRVLEEAERAVDAFDRGVAAIDRHARTTAGTVRIATVPSAALTILPGVIAAFRILHPAVRLEISDADSADVLRRLQFDEADLGIASARPDQGRDGALISTEALGITCRPDGAIARAPGPASWQLLDLEPLIANPLCALVPHEGLRRREAESPMAVRNTMTLLAMVRAGQGATILPESALRSLAPDLAFLAPADPPATRRLTLYDNAHRRPGPAVAAFAAALMRHADTAPIK